VTVFLVGAGPGDPGLLTVRGAELLRAADVVVYDRLSVASLLDLAPPSAELINVGKQPGRSTMEQEDISALLVERGKTGQVVVRLKGGDPFVFARGGEEALALFEAGVPFEVVPGVTSAIAVPAYAGIPLTMRHSSTLFTVITGHEDPDKGGELDWEAVARLGGTIVVLMGIGRLPKIVSRLMAGGLSGDTPAAAIQWGTRPEQRTVRATLATITSHELAPPSTIVIGKVAAMELNWFVSRPLFGRSVVVTRPRGQGVELSAALRSLGAGVVEVPLTEVVDPSDGGASLRSAVERIGEYDWVLVSSANGARRLLGALPDARALGSVRMAAVGPATADVLRSAKLVADLVPERYVAEGLLEAFPAPDREDGRILLVRAEVARDVLPDGLRAMGWTVDVVDAYRIIGLTIDDDQRAAIAASDAVTFTSSSAVHRFVDAVGRASVPPVVACIGPVTAATAHERGLTVDISASIHTTRALIDELVRFFEAHVGESSG
jgi:uroporphyrinogen III methyltransferase/synthase